MVSRHDDIDERFKGYFTAAESFARLVVPDDPSLADDLWSHWDTPARFAAKYPDWYRARWRLDVNDPDLDWSAQDVNPWSHLQDCLGVRGLVALVRPDAQPSGAIRALDDSRVPLPPLKIRWGWTTPPILDLGLDAFLTEASWHLRLATARVFARMRDFWSDEYVLTTLPIESIPVLEILARQADIYDEGLQVFGRRSLDI